MQIETWSRGCFQQNSKALDRSKTCDIFVHMDTKTFFTDGSILHLYGCGGYAAVPMNEDGSVDVEHAIHGCKYSVDIQEMELMAVVSAIRSVPINQPVVIFTDHKTICDVIGKRDRARCERGRNRNIWNQLRQLCHTRDVALHWVKAHAGLPGNVEADQFARAAARSLIA